VRGFDEESREYLATFKDAIECNPEIGQLSNRIADDLTPLKVLQLFRRIPAEDCELLDLDPIEGRPERMILTHLLVPPVCIRPSVINEMTSTSNEDDLTMKLREIIQIHVYQFGVAGLPTNLDCG
jgi:DNA-directed RNA polymerase III subunit RPC1